MKNKQNDKPHLTDEQRRILESEVKNLVISASAGSGKTYILIEKLKELICNKKVKLEKLLVLTFTKVAAEEIKSRLTNAILSMPATPELLQSLDSLPLSDISTIDSFCEKIIKRNINKLDIDENFSILDEKSALKLKKMAFLSTYQHFSRENIEMFDEIYLSFKKNKDAIEECIYSVQNYFSSASESAKLFDKFMHDDSLNNLAQERLKNYIREHFNSGKELLNLIQKDELTKAGLEFLEKANSILNVSLEGGIFEVCRKINELEVPSLRGKYDDEVKSIFSKVKEEIKKVTSLTSKYSTYPSDIEERCESGELSKAILTFYQHFVNLYSQMKLKRSAVDFADLEHFAHILLKDEEVKKGLQERYDYIFIDEYQDTNRLQESILKPIAEGGYFTAVGDIKQGIYGFRNASMEIMQEDIENFSAMEDGDALYLNGNFRTDNNILSFVNDIFKKIMTKESVGIDYQKSSMLKGLKGFEKDKFPSVIVDVVSEEEQEEKEADEIYDISQDQLCGDESKAGEVNAILSRIEMIIGEDIYDAKLGKFRPADYGDIALLFRGRSGLMKETVNALKNMGIPVTSDLKYSLIEDSQIALLISLLKLTLNLNDDISLASVMCSPFGRFTIDELAALRYENPTISFSEIIKNSNDDKILAFKKMIEGFKFDLQIFGGVKALCRLFNKFEYFSYLNSFPSPQEKISNINNLFKLIKGGQLDFNVVGIINTVEGEFEVKGGEGGGNSITATTIHATKGLEYPIVIICDAGESLNKPYTKSYVLSEKYGLGCNIVDFETMSRLPSPAFLAGRLDRQQREFIDEIMIFYVAMTRPQNHLFIIGCGKEKDFTFDSLNSQNSYLKFIFFALGENFTSQLFSQGQIKSENYSFNIVTGSSYEKESSEKIIKENSVFNEDMEDYGNFIYPGLKECKISYKNSVTGVMKHDQILYQENVGERVSSRQEAIEAGNAYHEALKILDFETIENLEDLIRQSEKLKNELSEGYFKYINFNILLKNILIIKKVTKNLNLIKEREFIMQHQVDEETSSSKNTMIIQGIVDLFAIGDKLVLIDYKYSSASDENVLKERYAQQIELYSKALEKALNRKVDEKYLLSLKEGKLIKID